MDHFEEVGLLDSLSAQGFEKKEGARFIRNGDICNFIFSDKHTEGWDWTWQMPRADFDHTMAKEIARKGAEVTFGAEVTNVIFDEKGHSTVHMKDKDGKESKLQAKFIIDSSGYGRVLPRILDLDIPSEFPKFSSVFTHVKDTNRPEGKEGTLISFDILSVKTWFWVIPFSNGITSLGFVGPTEWIESFKGSTKENVLEMIKLSGYFKDRFEDPDFCFDPIQIKNYACAVKQIHGKGYALTGNSTEFLDPVFSSGVCFATESGLKAAKLATRELNGETIDWDVEYRDYIRKGVGVFKTYVKEWYTGNLQTLFFHQPENPDVKKKICAVLAGYVWDETNPFVQKHDRIVRTLAEFIDLEK
jgi:flavin-dependent dehydrogenase